MRAYATVSFGAIKKNMDELLVKLRKTYPTNYAEIKKAHDFAEEAHRGQKRSSGEDYFIHPCAVVEILADFGFDSSTVIAAFCTTFWKIRP